MTEQNVKASLPEHQQHPSPSRQHTIRTYTFEAPTPPEPAHLAEEGAQHTHGREIRRESQLRRESALVTVVPRSTTPHGAPSIASSGLSVQEIRAPAPLLGVALLQQPGTYIVTDDSDKSVSTLQTDDSKEKFTEKTKYRYSLQRTDSYGERLATKQQLDLLETNHPLPPIAGSDFWNKARYLGLTLYRRLMIIVLLANIATISATIARASRQDGSFTYGDAATATGANLLAAILMRQEHIINLLFHLVCGLPHWTPLQIRRNAAKLAYNNGGIHSAAGNSALLWYIFYIILLVYQFDGTHTEETAISIVTAITLVLFVTIIVMAHPAFRRSFHDYWELSHRYCGWTAIGLVWAQTILVGIAEAYGDGHSLGHTLIKLPNFWFLIIITCCLIYPWLWLRRLPVEARQLSSHATELRFYNRNVPTCVGTRLSHSPLVENHGFATIANEDGEKGYTVLVSHAGDWTKAMITNPPKHIWQRGAPTTGVLRISSLFKPIVIIATGSGIGPCLSFLNVRREHPVRVIWSARFPEATYGREVMAKVLRADKDAIIIDTKKTGHPKLIALAYACVQEIQAEAVAIISNPKVTRDVVYGLEARKIPVFGAIFDS